MKSRQTNVPAVAAAKAGFPPLPPIGSAPGTDALVDCLPVRAPFAVMQAGRHPGLNFRGLARRIARLPKAAFVVRLRSSQSSSQTARQLLALSTIIGVDFSSTGYPCLFGAHCIIPVREDGPGSGSATVLPTPRRASRLFMLCGPRACFRGVSAAPI